MKPQRVLQAAIGLVLALCLHGTAKAATYDQCVYALNPSLANALSLSGSSAINASTCGIVVDSSSSTALNLTLSSRITAKYVTVTGGASITGASTVTPAPQLNAAAQPNPLSFLTPPTVGACTSTNLTVTGTTVTTLSSGTYCNGIHIGGSARVTFNPGTYVLAGGGLTLSNSATVTGTGVTFFLTKTTSYPYGPVSVGAASSLTLTAPTSISSPYYGILFFQDPAIPSGSAGSSFSGSAGTNLTGTLYFPTTSLTITGAASSGTYLGLVADTVSIGGSSTLNLGLPSGRSPLEPPVSVSVLPATMTLYPGQTQTFTPTVNNSSAGVTWSLNPNVGSISAGGVYTAPSTIAVPQTVTVTATSVEDTTKTATATITLNPPVVISAVAPATIALSVGQTQQFAATVTGSSNTAITWTITPTTGAGTMSAAGLFTAPASITTQQTVTVTATSQADITKTSTATVTLTPVSISAVTPATIALSVGQTQQFAATVTGSSNTGITWTISPATGAGTISAAGLYTAPASIATQQTVTVTATSQADTTKKSTGAITLNPVTISAVTPAAVALSIGQTQQFAATVTGSSNTGITWTITPATGAGTIRTAGLFTAPASVSTQQTVTVTATSQADTTKTSTATVTLNPITISAVTPATIALSIGQTQQFAATVTGSNNTAITWTITPTTGAGTISTAGLFTAPASITAPQTVTVTATSQADTTKTSTAVITLNPPVSISAVTPATVALSVGQTQQFAATVTGSSNTGITWTITPTTGAGTIGIAGLFTAPASITTQQTVTVTATSQADTTKTSTATVTLNPVTISAVTPATIALSVGQTQQFAATVTGSSNTGITWTITPTTGAGTIGTAGLFTAPASITTQQTVTVTATSQADSTKTSTATITLNPPVTISAVTPATIALSVGQTQQFAVTVTGSSNTGITWTITPTTGAGTINTAGLFTAPASITTQQTVTVTATSQADTTKTSTATVTLNPVTISAVTPATIALSVGQTQQFAATVTGSSNTGITWTITPTTGAGTISTAGLFTAPASITTQQTVTVTATSQADTTKASTATVTLNPVTISAVTPATIALSVGQTQQFAATVTGSSNTGITWTITPTTGAGTISTAGLFTAPATITTQQTVTVTATSQADTTKTSTAAITLNPPVSISAVTPATIALSVGQTQQFAATVTGSSNTGITWTIIPTTGAGTISTAGLYTAPATITTQQTVTVTAASQADTTKTSTATVTLNPVTISAVTPATISLSVGQTQQFAATVTGSSNTGITWTINPATGQGTISAAGLYTAPVTITTQQSVTVTATSQADTTKTSTAIVTLSPVSISAVTPATIALSNGQTQQFSATVTGSTNTAITWTINPTTGAGTISTAGLYTAPATITTQQTVTVTATSQADTTMTSTATVALNPPVTISVVTPLTVALTVGQTQQFTATVTGSTNTGITWTIIPATGAGTIGTGGLYTAPVSIAAQQTVTVTAASKADTTKTSTATVTLNPIVTSSLTPATVTLSASQTQQFATGFSGNPQVNWTLNPVGAGAISPTGLYTAPNCITTAQTVTVTATNSANSSQVATATVTLTVSNNTYAYHRVITVDHTKVDSDQTDFPLLVSGTYSYLATTANGGRLQNANGYDIIFTDATGATQLDYEIESYNPATGQLVAWVRIPSLSSSADTAIFMWYGNSAITTSQANPKGVWTNYRAVYHLAVSSPSAADSTSGGNNGPLHNVSPSSGEIGGGGQFNGTTSYMQIPAAVLGGSPTPTFAVWLKTTSTGIVVGQTDGTLPNGTPAPDGWSGLLFIDSTGHIHATSPASPNPAGDVTGPIVNDNRWHLITYNSFFQIEQPLLVVLYVDGQQVGSASPTVAGFKTATTFSYFLGTGFTAPGSGAGSWSYLAGGFDELRFSGGLRFSPLTEYHNQYSPGTFYSISSESTAPSTSLLVSPLAPSLGPSQTQQLTVTSLGSCLATVSWSISPPALGTVSASGLYTAPAGLTDFFTDTVIATNPNVTTMTGTVTISLGPTFVNVAPFQVTLYGGQTQQFTATVTNANTAVVWTVDPPTGAGTVTQAGLYTAPTSIAAEQMVTLTATSQADNTEYNVALITLEPPVSVTISPPSTTMFGGQTLVFIATVANSADTSVIWSINPPGAGAISGSGFYTAPAAVTSPQTLTVTATSVANPAKSISATITLINGSLFSYHRAIVVDHTKVPNTDQTSFPVLISGTYSYLANPANGGKVQSPNGFDIVFTADCNGYTVLNHEIESYNPVTGQFVAWVNLPVVSHTADTVLYMWYGNPSVTTTLERPSLVWDSHYFGVLHLGKNSALSAADSTGNLGGPDVPNNNVFNVTPVPGLIGEGAGLTNSSDFRASGFQYYLNAATVSVWFNTFNAQSGAGLVGFAPFLEIGTTRNPPAGLVFQDSYVFQPGAIAPGNFNDGQWHYAVGTHDGSKLNIFVDGVPVASTPTGMPGYFYGITVGGSYTGSVDEARASTIARSADWIATEYNNQKSPSTFYTVYGENTTTFLVTPLISALNASGTQQILATVLGNCTNPVVTWSLNPAGVGTINATGLYTAPPTITTPQVVTITATAQTTPPVSGSVTVVLQPVTSNLPVSVSVVPGSVTLFNGNTQQFNATVANTSNTAVTWSSAPSGVGSVSLSGLYTAPDAIAAPQTVTVTATTQALPSQSSSATIMLEPGLGVPSTNSPFSSVIDLVAESVCRGIHDAPSVNAGINQLINMSGGTAAVTVTGSVSNYTLPPGQSLIYEWSLVSGPAPVQFATANAASTQVTFSTAGNYTLQLSVNDHVLTGFGMTTVTVAPAFSPAGSSLIITPPVNGPIVIGQVVALQIKLQNPTTNSVSVQVSGVTPQTVNLSLDNNSSATFRYTASTPGTDTVVANAQGTISNTATVTWITTTPHISSSPVTGRFFSADGSGTFNTASTATSAFSQTFASIDFNPAAGTINGNTSAVTTLTRPFTEVQTDQTGKFAGTVAAQGNGYQAGLGTLLNFSAVFTGSLNIPAAGPVTFTFNSDDAFIFGVGNGASRVSGPQTNTPPVSPFQFYLVMGGVNQRSAPATNAIVVNFPAPGVYPYEVDYAKGGDNNLTLTMTAGGVPIPAVDLLTMAPNSVPSTTAGQPISFAIAATDQNGAVLANAPIIVNVTGVNQQTRNLITDGTGLVNFAYVGSPFLTGNDLIQAEVVVNGAAAYSNSVSVTWNSGANMAPTVEAGFSQTVTLSSGVSLSGTVSDDGLPNGTLSIAWSKVSGPGAVVFAYPNQVVTTATFNAVGTYVLQLSASDGVLTTTSQVNIIVAANPTWSTGWLASPIDGITISSPTPVTLISGITLTGGTLTVYPVSNPSAVTVLLPSTTGSGQIATFDPSTLADGSYFVDLRATNSQGVTQDNLALVKVVGDYKPGRVTATITDLTVPAPGLPIQIQRTYDSLVRATSGDFGNGWNLSISLQVEVSPTSDVTLTVNGRRRTFYFTPPANPVFTFWYTPQYTAEPGLYGSLTTTGDNCSGVLAHVGQVWQCSINNAGNAYQPTGYKYTDPSGRVYSMGPTGAIQSIKDLNGNTLTITANGITSSSGVSAPFVRDGQGRITQITDPLGNSYIYLYTPNGNLAGVTYPGITTPSQYQYDATNLLTQETDHRGNLAGSSTYYSDGRLKSVTDSVGNTTQYSYVVATNTTTVTNPDGGTVITRNDAYGMPLSITDPLNHTTSYAYDSNHNQLSMRDPLGNTTTYTYDSHGFRTSTRDPLGNTSTTLYNQFGGPTAISDPLNQMRNLTYDSAFRPITITDGLGQLAAIGYDTFGNATTLTDANGKVSHLIYDGNADVTSTTDPLNRIATATYDVSGRRLSMTDPRGNQVLYAYDALGRLLQTTNADNSVTSATYDGNGNVTSRTDEQNRTTSYVYDAADRVIQTVYPDNATSATTYDWRGQPLTETDQLGRVNTYHYDLAGQLLSVISAMGTSDQTVTHSTFDADGRKTSEIDPRGNTTTYSYDAASRRTAVTNALNQIVTTTYDVAGRRMSVTDALGRQTQFTYDLRNRLTKSTFPDGTTAQSSYDGVGHVLTSTDQAGKVTSSNYDASGQLTSVIDALNQTTSYTYDLAGNRLTKTDANSHTTTYTYDALNRVKTRVLPAGGSLASVTYNPAGTLATAVDFNGKTTTFAYDSLNRLTTTTPDPSLSQPAISFTYTATGRRASMIDGIGTTTYTYDNLDRMLSKGAPQGTLSYTYDAGSNRISVLSSNGNGASTSYGYDVLNRLQSVTDSRLPSAQRTTTYGYDMVGNVTSVVYSNGVRVTPTLDNMNRATNLAINGSSALVGYTYTYGATGTKLSAVESTGRNQTFNYDSVYRMMQETISADPNSHNGALGYSLDPVGNRLTRSSTLSGISPAAQTYDADDRLTSDTYDPNGNTLTSGGRTFAYDFENRLTSVNSGSVTLSYDGDGDRVAKTAGGVTTQYLVDDLNPTGLSQVIEEITAGAVQRSYAYGLGRLSEDRVVSGSIVPSFYSYDGHGDVRMLTDSEGAVTDRYDYDAFGNLVNSTGSTPNVYLYQGEQFDSETGFYYLRARYYMPATGRFLSVDPETGVDDNPTAAHPYVYAGDDPVDRLDPSGRGFESIIALQPALSVAPYFALTSPIANNFTSGTFNGVGRSFICIMSHVASQYRSAAGLFSFGDCTTSAFIKKGPGKPGGGGGGGGGHGGGGGGHTECPTEPNPDYDPTVWNSADHVLTNNCYSYAANVLHPAGPQHAPQPGEDSGKTFTELTCGNIKAAARADGLVNQKDGCCPSGYYKVRLFIGSNVGPPGTKVRLGPDYHWYRQDSNLLWSSKHGLTPVGPQVTDPKADAKAWLYNEDCGTLCAANH